MPRNSAAKHPIKSAQNTVRIIEALKELDEAGVTEVADYLDLSKSSVHNYLDTLRHEGYVVKGGNRYRVGLKFLDLGTYAREKQQLFETGKPEVKQLAEETGEVVNLLVEEQGRGIFLHRERGPQAVKLDTYTGMSIRLHHAALGKAILAHLPEERVRSIVDYHGLPRRTENTVTDLDDLFEELETVREQGYALDMEEHLDGLRCVAVPIFSDGTSVEGAISVAGPSSRMKGERLRETLPEKLQNATNVIELNITHS